VEGKFSIYPLYSTPFPEFKNIYFGQVCSSMKYKVSLVKTASYDNVEASIQEAVDLLGGMDKFLKPGWKVLLKPNLLFGSPPEKCVNTHPEVLRAVVKMVKEAGCAPMIGDSPIVGSGVLHARLAGMLKVCREENVPWVNFEDDALEVQGKVVFKKLEIARYAIEADAIINLPKVKTHGQTYLTLCVKNMFGIVPGVRKSRWHMSSGRDVLDFAKMLVEVCYLRKPVLNVVDGILAMDGNGPRGGNPFPLNYIIAGEDPTATDCAICHLLDASTDKVPTLIAAQKMALGETNLNNIEILGEELGKARVKNFRFRGQMPPSDMSGFGFLVPLFKDGLTSQPKIDHNICDLCKQCLDHCPAIAMSLVHDHRREKDKLEIDLDLCIRCYCCSEICSEGAISVRQGWMWNLVPSFLK
jgi:uncharacterized protein (DUF362 family)/Pyruvate/2-oxoacid:ferredoxin oxidoreductase delta subunit